MSRQKCRQKCRSKHRPRRSQMHSPRRRQTRRSMRSCKYLQKSNRSFGGRSIIKKAKNGKCYWYTKYAGSPEFKRSWFSTKCPKYT